MSAKWKSTYRGGSRKNEYWILIDGDDVVAGLGYENGLYTYWLTPPTSFGWQHLPHTIFNDDEAKAWVLAQWRMK